MASSPLQRASSTAPRADDDPPLSNLTLYGAKMSTLHRNLARRWTPSPFDLFNGLNLLITLYTMPLLRSKFLSC